MSVSYVIMYGCDGKTGLTDTGYKVIRREHFAVPVCHHSEIEAYLR